MTRLFSEPTTSYATSSVESSTQRIDSEIQDDEISRLEHDDPPPSQQEDG